MGISPAVCIKLVCLAKTPLLKRMPRTSVPQLMVSLTMSLTVSLTVSVSVGALCFAFDLHTLIEGQLLKAY